MTPFPKPPRKLQKVRACTEVANWNASFPAQGMAERKAVNYISSYRRDSRAERGSLLPLEMNAYLPGCVWNATPRSLSPLERPSSNAPSPVESREAPPTSSFPGFSEPP